MFESRSDFLGFAAFFIYTMILFAGLLHVLSPWIAVIAALALGGLSLILLSVIKAGVQYGLIGALFALRYFLGLER